MSKHCFQVEISTKFQQNPTENDILPTIAFYIQLGYNWDSRVI